MNQTNWTAPNAGATAKELLNALNVPSCLRCDFWEGIAMRTSLEIVRDGEFTDYDRTRAIEALRRIGVRLPDIIRL